MNSLRVVDWNVQDVAVLIFWLPVRRFCNQSATGFLLAYNTKELVFCDATRVNIKMISLKLGKDVEIYEHSFAKTN
jgi:hypothetical protein